MCIGYATQDRDLWQSRVDSTNATKTGILVQHELLAPKMGLLDHLRVAGPSAISSHITISSYLT